MRKTLYSPLLQYCSSTVAILLLHCCNTAPPLLQYCSSTVAILLLVLCVAGSVFYRIMETDPPNSQKCDSACLREIVWQVYNYVYSHPPNPHTLTPSQLNKYVNFPLPCECPPSPLLPPPPYFSLLLPPGLNPYCLSLFSLLLPLLYPSSRTHRAPRTPAILITGNTH